MFHLLICLIFALFNRIFWLFRFWCQYFWWIVLWYIWLYVDNRCSVQYVDSRDIEESTFGLIVHLVSVLILNKSTKVATQHQHSSDLSLTESVRVCIPSTDSSLASVKPIGFGLWGDREANTPHAWPLSRGGRTFDGHLLLVLRWK